MTNTVNNEGLGIKELLFAFIVSLVLMFLAGSSYAQGIATAKIGDATEVASAGKEVKSVIAVPAKLAKAMDAAKVVKKEVGKNERLSKSKAAQTTYYFRYTGGDSEEEYLDPDNWEYLSGGLPGSNPCSGAPNMVCVLNTQDISEGSVSTLIDFLTNDVPSAAGYCQTLARKSYQKPLE